jgi:alkylated DNA repair dioxygenase AlkB
MPMVQTYPVPSAAVGRISVSQSPVPQAAVRQPSLFDEPAAGQSPALGALTQARRIRLDDTAWLDVLPGWLSGSESLFDSLLKSVPWRAEQRMMYQRVVQVPRLEYHYAAGEPLPHPMVEQARLALSAHYRPELAEDFVSVGLCLYRDGNDSVAWHGDRIGRGANSDTMVAILAIGAARTLAFRPRAGGSGPRISLGHGDLAVMGGSCQRTWDHAIPKSSSAQGPRISLQFRPRGVR